MEYLSNKSSVNSDNISKLPFFLNKSGSPKSWFQLLEAKFDFSALSSSTKFYQTISCLPPDILKLIGDDLVQASTSCNPYNSLKDLLIEHFTTQPDEVIKNYFSKNNQIGMKPSQFLAKAIHDLELQHPGIIENNDQTVREYFMSGLPQDVQKIVNGISNIELCKLADFADKIYEKPIKCNERISDKPNGRPVESFNDKSENSLNDKAIIEILTTELSSLKLQVKSLQDNFDRLEQKVDGKYSKLQLTAKTSVQHIPSPPLLNDLHNSYEKTKQRNFCFYHLKYGSGAQKCQLGCSYLPKPFDLKVSSICIHHAKNNGDTSQCVAGCTRYTSFNGNSR